MTPDELAARMALAELEFEAKGFTHRQAEIAVRRAAKLANTWASRCRPEYRETVYQALMERELVVSEGWIRNATSDETKRRYAEGVRKARERNHLREAYSDMGLDAQEVIRRWEESEAEAVAEYDRKFS